MKPPVHGTGCTGTLVSPYNFFFPVHIPFTYPYTYATNRNFKTFRSKTSFSLGECDGKEASAGLQEADQTHFHMDVGLISLLMDLAKERGPEALPAACSQHSDLAIWPFPNFGGYRHHFCRRDSSVVPE